MTIRSSHDAAALVEIGAIGENGLSPGLAQGTLLDDRVG
jgi:hypothetical protein